MAVILDKEYTAADKASDIVSAIIAVSSDKNHRILQADENVWLKEKLKEVLRLARLLKRKV